MAQIGERRPELRSILDWVRFYRSRGLTVLRVIRGTKKCRIKDWQKLPPEELEKMITENHNIGIRLDGLSVLDLERKELLRVFMEKSAEEIAKITWVAETGKGYHIYFRGTLPGKGTIKADKLVEFRTGNDVYVVAPPSLHPTGAQYRWLSEVELIEIATPKDTESLERIYHKVEVLKEFGALILALEKIWTPSHRHHLAIWLSGCLRKSGVDYEDAKTVLTAIACLAHDEELEDRLRALDDTYKKPIDQIGAWSYLEEELRGIVGPEEAEKIMKLIPRREPEVRVINARVDEPSKPKLKVREILSLVLPDGRVAEAIGIRNALGEYDPALLILGPEGFRVERELVVGNTIYRGVDPNDYPYEPYVVEDLENIKSRTELVNEIYAEVKRFIDANPKERAIFTAYILMSYCPELFETVPYLYLVGDNASGKSHTLQLFDYLCYRPLNAVSCTTANIYSYLGKEKSDPPLTILEDEFQGSDRDTEKMKIYKAGYKRGKRVPRITIDQNGRRRQEHYNAFGPKVVAAEKLIENKGFLERCIVIEMVEGKPEKDHYDRKDEARFARLRAELLKWRMAVLAGREKLPELELGWLEGRDRELYLPLLTVLAETPLYSILEGYIKEEIKRKKEEKRGSLEAQITAVVLELAKECGAEIPFPRIWDRLKERVNGVVPSYSTIAIETVMDTEVYGRITKKQIAALLRDKLGLRAKREWREGKTVVVYQIMDSEKIRRTAIKFGLEDPLPLNTSIPNEERRTPCTNFREP
jgi:DNA-directed RNA polymerase subunit F